MTTPSKKMNRCEAEYMAACVLAGNGKTANDIRKLFAEAFDEKIIDRKLGKNGRMIEYKTYFAKDCADIGVEAGVVSSDGVPTGAVASEAKRK